MNSATKKLGIELHADYHTFNKHAANGLYTIGMGQEAGSETLITRPQEEDR